MNENALIIFKYFINNKGCLKQRDEPNLWNMIRDEKVQHCLDIMASCFDFKIQFFNDRVYLIPNLDNTMFLQTNYDYKKSISILGSTNIDLYLINYMIIYLINEFFHGEGSNLLVRPFITRDEMIENFTAQCSRVVGNGNEEEDGFYGFQFMRLSQNWLAKKDGNKDDGKIETKNGVVNKVIQKLKIEELFLIEDDKIFPTDRGKDLIPIALKKDRVQDINQYLRGGDLNATNQ